MASVDALGPFVCHEIQPAWHIGQPFIHHGLQGVQAPVRRSGCQQALEFQMFVQVQSSDRPDSKRGQIWRSCQDIGLFQLLQLVKVYDHEGSRSDFLTTDGVYRKKEGR
jgi:hypothetical protein